VKNSVAFINSQDKSLGYMKLLKIADKVNALTLSLEKNQAIALLLNQESRNLIG